jgi:hypothetical protein
MFRLSAAAINDSPAGQDENRPDGRRWQNISRVSAIAPYFLRHRAAHQNPLLEMNSFRLRRKYQVKKKELLFERRVKWPKALLPLIKSCLLNAPSRIHAGWS